MIYVLLKPGLENFEHYFTNVWDECNCAVVWVFFGIAFLWDWNENWPFPVLWPLRSFPSLLAYWVQHFHSIIFQDLKCINNRILRKINEWLHLICSLIIRMMPFSEILKCKKNVCLVSKILNIWNSRKPILPVASMSWYVLLCHIKCQITIAPPFSSQLLVIFQNST